MSIHFTRAELIRSRIAQERGIANDPPESLLSNIDFTMAGAERVRAFLKWPMNILSGYRSPELNDAVGGVPNSQHLSGQAIDFTCEDYGDPERIVSDLSVVRFIIGIDQLILERTWVHASFTLQPRYEVLKAVGPHFVQYSPVQV